MKPEEIELLSHYQIRTTGEPVVVLAMLPTRATTSIDPQAIGGATPTSPKFLVRRPVQSDAGIHHVDDEVYAEELETHQQATDREIQQLVYREKVAVEAQQNLQNSPVPARPVIVKPN